MSLLNNFAQLFGGNQTQVVDNQQASRLLKNLDDMLEESWKMLTGIKARVPAPEFDSMETRHNQLYLMVVDVKSDIRGREGKKVFFANTAERDEFYVQIRQILTQCHIHHNDVLTVSRRTYERNLRLQAAESSSASTPVPTEKEDEPNSQWFSMVSESTYPPDPSGEEVGISSLSQSDLESSGSSRFIATVVHIPKSALAIEEELKAKLPKDDDTYYRIMICGNGRKKVITVDLKPHSISADYDDDAENSQDDILRVGHTVMQSNTQKLEGHQVVHSYRGLSFISSFISSWDPNGMPLGGMV